MTTNIVDLRGRMETQINDKNINKFVEKLNSVKNKGVILKRYGLLEKGERWRNNDLQDYMLSKNYNTVYCDTYVKYVFEKKTLNTIQLNELYRQTNEQYEIVEFGQIVKPIKLINYFTKDCVLLESSNTIIPINLFNDYFKLEPNIKKSKFISKPYKNKYFELTNQFEIIDSNYISSEGMKGRKIKDINNNNLLLISNGIKLSIIGEYKTEILYNTRRELLQKFEQILPFTANRLLEIVYYKQPDYKSLYNREYTFKSQKAYEFAHRFGERRIMQGQFIIQDNKFKERDGYLLIKDITDNNIEKPLNTRSMISFTFNEIKYYIDEK